MNNVGSMAGVGFRFFEYINLQLEILKQQEFINYNNATTSKFFNI